MFALVGRFICVMDIFIAKVFYAVIGKIEDDLRLVAPGSPAGQRFQYQ